MTKTDKRSANQRTLMIVAGYMTIWIDLIEKGYHDMPKPENVDYERATYVLLQNLVGFAKANNIAVEHDIDIIKMSKDTWRVQYG